MLKNNKKGFNTYRNHCRCCYISCPYGCCCAFFIKIFRYCTRSSSPNRNTCYCYCCSKRVIEKYSQTKDENISLNATDNKWIEDFVDEGGEIQGSVTVTNKEIARLLYKASNLIICFI